MKNRRYALPAIRRNSRLTQSVKHGQTTEELLQNQSFRYKRSDDIADWSIETPIGKSRDTQSAAHSLRLRSISLDLGLPARRSRSPPDLSPGVISNEKIARGVGYRASEYERSLALGDASGFYIELSSRISRIKEISLRTIRLQDPETPFFVSLVLNSSAPTTACPRHQPRPINLTTTTTEVSSTGGSIRRVV